MLVLLLPIFGEDTQKIDGYNFVAPFILLSQLRYRKFRKYSSNHILKAYKAPNQSVVKSINMIY